MVGQLGDVLGAIGDGILAIEDGEHVAPFDREHEAAGQVVADLVLDLVGLVFEVIDLAAACADLLDVPARHGLDQRHDFARTFEHHVHVFLHGTNR